MSCTISEDHPVIVISQEFCAVDSDITIQSNDGVHFHLHKINLKTSFGSWESYEEPQGDGIIQLPESSATLNLLFQFCYPRRHPDLANLEFDVLAGVAHATERYKLYAAMNVCKIRMRDTLPWHARDILVYAATYGYDDIVDIAAPLVVLKTGLSDLLYQLPPSQRIPWVIYHESWQTILHDAISYYETWAASYRTSIHALSYLTCTLCGKPVDAEADVNRLLRRLGSGLVGLVDLDATFVSSCCYAPHMLFAEWRREVEAGVKRVPAFSALAMSECARSAVPSLPRIPTLSDTEVPEFFHAPDADIIFASTDGALFHIYSTNLHVCAGGFPPPGFETSGEVVHLTETGTTLRLLFQFCYPIDQPDVELMNFDDLALLAEAAEKYQVYPAMNICKIYMKKLVPKLASHILGYAARHDYSDILDIAAPLVVVKERLSETLPKLPGNMIMRWVRYFEVVRPSTAREKKLKVPGGIPAFSAVK